MQLVELMHGDVKLQSQIGVGTKATFWIPFKKAEYLGSNASPLVSLASIPDRLQSDVSIASSDDRHTPPVTPSAIHQSNTPRKSVSGVTGASTESSAPSDTLAEAERKDFHILVVEDKSVSS